MTSRTRKLGTPPWLRSYWQITLALFTVSAITFFIQRSYFPNVYPYNNPLFQRYSFQFDFQCFVGRFQYFGTPQFFSYPAIPPFTYPAPVALVYEIFFRFFGQYAHAAYLSVCVLGYLVAGVLFGRALVQRGLSIWVSAGLVATVILTSYPIALQLYLANVEALMWIVVALGIWAWYRERFYLAAMCFGLATSMKIFPFVYFGLLESRKRYKEVVFGLAICIVVSIAALRMLGPLHQAYHGIHAGLAYFEHIYVENFNQKESGMDHSLFALAKVMIWRHSHEAGFHRPSAYLLAIEAAIGLALYPRIRRLPEPNQLLALSIASVLLPIVSHDYTLLHLYAPWALFMICGLESTNSRRKALTFTLCCFAVLFTSQDFLIWKMTRYAGQLKCLTLIVLAAMALWGPAEDCSLVNRPNQQSGDPRFPTATPS